MISVKYNINFMLRTLMNASLCPRGFKTNLLILWRLNPRSFVISINSSPYNHCPNHLIHDSSNFKYFGLKINHIKYYIFKLIHIHIS